MLCSKCPAYEHSGCTISIGKNGASCRLTDEQIQKRVILKIKTEKLDKIALRYSIYHNEEDKKLWYKILMENS